VSEPPFFRSLSTVLEFMERPPDSSWTLWSSYRLTFPPLFPYLTPFSLREDWWDGSRLPSFSSIPFSLNVKKSAKQSSCGTEPVVRLLPRRNPFIFSRTPFFESRLKMIVTDPAFVGRESPFFSVLSSFPHRYRRANLPFFSLFLSRFPT